MRDLSTTPRFPRPADPSAADRLREAFAALGAAECAFAASDEGRAVLDCLGGNAPYLADLACRESACLLATLRDGPEKAFAATLDALHTVPLNASRTHVAAALRQAKRRAALAIAVADLGHIWQLPQITGALSELAETALRIALRHLLRELHESGQAVLPQPDNPEQGAGFVALALGKLGARELNYSSDIDLVLLYNPAASVYPPEAQPMMARLARDLVALLSQRDADGYVFRVDLRLRPDPAATPAVISLPAALTYYESQGRTWERAAFSKARPVAGDIALGEEFLAAIRPFIWRRHLDFAAVSDIHSMKRQIDARQAANGLLGHDVKLGRGGIREIEFIVQTLSLVWGGQDPALRIPPTLPALAALAKSGHMPAADAAALDADYRELRRVEHRLQMIADRQTHALPSSEAALDAFAIFLDAPNFRHEFSQLQARVHGHFRAFFSAGQDTTPDAWVDPGTAGPPPPAFAEYLTKLGFSDTRHVAERLRAWSGGQVPALRAQRARDLLEGLLPPLFAALGGQPDPDKAFALFDTLLSQQRAGVQLLSLFQHNPALLRRLAAVLGAAPALADHLANDAQALEALLSPNDRYAAPKPVLRRLLQDAVDFEQAVAVTRHFVRREDFHLSVATLEGRLNADDAGRLRSNLAAAALSTLLPRVIAQHQLRYGRLKRTAFGIVALGKAGSGEMLAGSDLDLMFIYDHGESATPPTQYFMRLSNALTAALTAQGLEGPLYQVDMRLRPSGNQGPVAVSLTSFQHYHAHESWTWERLALTRASVFATTPGFGPVLRAALDAALARPESPGKILRDTVAMRDRLMAELPPRGPFDLKTRVGGMMELAFIAEALQLVHGPANPKLFHANTTAALQALGAAGHLPEADMQALVEADFLWRSIHGINRITGLRDRATQPPPSMAAPLLRVTNLPDLPALFAAMDRAGAAVRDCFERHINHGAL
ncbi:MAG TPA: bifunctional [glutamine synthetase] adenylyltransferase/[glutamine synthetase]-adenylyl-L-tyrosine phosphorylase [Acidocella sp.]|nr:bifunctional [glutamine synthetase] adenylyltransferase/[glutamine synthetase]-adenylyl-L-tyrosine phosphorylase [Acidocella sp.]